MTKLRGHHLICLHFFNGEGYDERFITNLEDNLRLAEKEHVEITSGADEVCSACYHLKEGRCMQSEGAEQEIREMDAKALELLGLSISEKVSWKALMDKIPGIFPEWHSLYCVDCDWRRVCEKNASFRELLKAR